MRCPSSESMVQLLLKPGRRESIPTPHPAPLRKAGLLMRRTILLLTTVSLALLLVGGVAASTTVVDHPTARLYVCSDTAWLRIDGGDATPTMRLLPPSAKAAF